MMTNRVNRQQLRNGSHAAGMGLLDVVLAIAVFAFGMLALVQLQGNLTRSSADANTRTVAASIAQDMVERLRGYRSVLAADNDAWDYLEIQGDVLNDTVTLGNIDYERTATVTHFWWDDENEWFVRTTSQDPSELPEHMQELIYPDFKLIRLDVAWGNSDDFYVRDRTAADDVNTADLATGSITVYEIIPSSPPSLGSELLASLAEDTGPMVDYTVRDNPDVIKLTLDESGGKFKEAGSPAPDVFRGDHVETWFDVVTYSQLNPDAQAAFLRREEFVAVDCYCQLDTAPDAEDYGRLPTLWNGVTYTEGAKVAKPIGISAPPPGEDQSEYCDTCCRDHHDGYDNSAEGVYNPVNAGGPNADHPHYAKDDEGNFTVAGDGDIYVESCRLIRKDGFMRVTQDANQGTLVAFPECYLDVDPSLYSAYVVDAAGNYYTSPNNQSALPQPNPPDEVSWLFSARDELGPGTDIPKLIACPATDPLDQQQMRARAVYTDYLTSAAQDVIDNCFPLADRNDDCRAPNASTPLEIYPFFELQMTWLASWGNESLNNVVTVTSKPIEEGNTHIRGLVELSTPTSEGRSTVLVTSLQGNPGLTATGSIEPIYSINEDRLYVDANLNETPVLPIGTAVSGGLVSVVMKVPASRLTLTPSDNIVCRSTDTTWTCAVGTPGTLTVGNYSLRNKDIYVCSDLPGRTVGTDPETGAETTTFSLPASGDIWITEDSACGR